jgi:hypothetical protein
MAGPGVAAPATADPAVIMANVIFPGITCWLAFPGTHIIAFLWFLNGNIFEYQLVNLLTNVWFFLVLNALPGEKNTARMIGLYR